MRSRSGGAAHYHLDVHASGSRVLARELHLVITDVDSNQVVYGGLLADFLGIERALSPGGGEQLTVALSLPHTSGNGLQGAAVEVSFALTATLDVPLRRCQ